MQLIVGLGNIGNEYEWTRHNVGFEVLDVLAKEFKVSFSNVQLGAVAQFKHKGKTFILLKPSTFMNLSGKAVRFWLQCEKILPENLLVVLDDLNLAYGKQRLRPSGTDGGHNGLKNIDLTLGNNKYPRLRVGIGDSFSKGRQVDYVLGKWTKKEEETIQDVLRTAADAVLAFGTLGMALAMNGANTQKEA